jgi:hypothetical protein
LEDNYLALMPGEQRDIHVTVPAATGAARLAIEADAWNAPRASTAIAGHGR